MKKLLAIMSVLILNACVVVGNKIEVKISNNSNQAITNTLFTTTEKLDSLKFDRVASNEGVTGFISMQNNKTDGSYLLTFTRANGKMEKIEGGYYSNGSPLEQRVNLVVENDTVIFEFDNTVE